MSKPSSGFNTTPKAFVMMLLFLDVLFCRGTGQSGIELNEASYRNFRDEKGLIEDKVPRKSIGDAENERTIPLEGSSDNLSLEYLTNSLNLTSEDLELSYETIWYFDGEERRSVTIKRAGGQTTKEEILDTKDSQSDTIKNDRDQAVKTKRRIFGNDDRKRLLPTSFEAQQTPHSAACKVVCKGVCRLKSCSGILIGSRHVLTSAHCVDGETAGALRVGFLERNGRLHWYNVMKAYMPIKWTASKALSSDYAVLKLTRPTRRTYVNIASLALSKGSVISFTGFPGDKAPNSLWTTKCSVYLVNGGVIFNKCDAARGSSGSGVFVTDSSGTKVVGVLSGETKRSRHGRLNVAVHFTRSKVNQINGWTRK